MNMPFRGARRLCAGLVLAAMIAPVTLAHADKTTGSAAHGGHAPGAVVQAFWDRVWSAGDVDAIDELMADDFEIVSAGQIIGPRDRFKAWVASFFDNIDDLELEVLDLFTDGGKVATRWRCSGRLTGSMFGVKGTGQEIAFTGINLMTVEDGKIKKAWVERDALGLARSLGAVK